MSPPAFIPHDPVDRAFGKSMVVKLNPLSARDSALAESGGAKPRRAAPGAVGLSWQEASSIAPSASEAART
jgi:hypothetical protein